MINDKKGLGAETLLKIILWVIASVILLFGVGYLLKRMGVW